MTNTAQVHEFHMGFYFLELLSNCVVGLLHVVIGNLRFYAWPGGTTISMGIFIVGTMGKWCITIKGL